MLPVRFAAAALAVATLSSCASDFGGSVSGGKDALSPEERRLQAVESRVGVLARRLDTVNLTELDQDSTRLRDDLRTVRGEVERLRYDFDQSQKRSRDLEARLQRLESGAGLVAPAVAAPGTVGLPPASAPATLPAPAAVPATKIDAAPPPVAPVASAGLPTVTISQPGAAASPEEEAAYLAAFDLLQNGKYDEALRGFRAQLEKWPQGRFADAALRWSGEAYIIKGDRKAALTAFQTIVQRFPKSPQAPEAMYKVGLMQMELGQETEGRATLKRVIAQYPQTTPARAAQQRLEPAKR